MKIRRATIALLTAVCVSCTDSRRDVAVARNFLLITIDTLRADRVGAYGYARARTPTLDGLARRGVLFEYAYASAPITLTSHATILTGRYPPGHGARDNGTTVSPSVPTMATELKAHGFQTAAFVAAFPLDHQFGLAKGFDVYSDRLPRDPDGRPANERPASQVVGEAIAWLQQRPAPGSRRPAPFFVWVHLFEPHAPYAGDLSRPVADRYDDEIATADREVGRLIAALGGSRRETLIVVAGDHGEAFGEHGEFAHGIFVYDVTLHVPLLIVPPGREGASRVTEPVTLADVAPTVMSALGYGMKDADGIDLRDVMAHDLSAAAPREDRTSNRELYAESFAPLIEFGWAPLRSVRSGGYKYIAAPKSELYHVATDSAERSNLIAAASDEVRRLSSRVDRYSTDQVPVNASGAGGMESAAAERLRALGYSARSGSAILNPHSTSRTDGRPDPKDRRELTARLAQVTSGELTGAALLTALEGIVRDDPRNGQARLRLAYALLQGGNCQRAESEFQTSIASGLRTADTYLGLAACEGQRRDLRAAENSLNEARRLEPDNPVVLANLGILKANQGDLTAAIGTLQEAVAKDSNLIEARFNLALALASAGRRSEAKAAANEILARLPSSAPQRPEVERLLKALQ
jgi:choline-sulfatase